MDATAVETVLIEIVNDLTQDWGLDLDEDVGAGTKLVHDLSFGSVDVIQLCVAIEQHYEQKMGFKDLLMQNGSYVEDITLSQIGAFVSGRLREQVR